MPLTQTLDALVTFIERYAVQHYEDGGWDVVVETWDDHEVKVWLIARGATDEASALAAFAPLVDAWADQQANARNTRF